MAPLMKESRAARVGETIGQVAPTVLIPGGVAGGFLKRAATSALAGGVIGAAQPVTKEESLLENTIKGALASGGVSAGMSVAGKLLNAAIGKLPANSVRRLSEKYKIPISLSEEMDSPSLQMAESWLEKVPVIGIRKFREQQNDAAEQAAKNFIGKYIVHPGTDDAIGTNRAFSSALYERLKSTVAEVSDKPVVPKETKIIASTLLKRYPALFKQFQDTKTEGVIKNIVGDTSKVTKTGTDVLLTGQAIKPKLPTFDDMWALRDGLGDMLYKAKRKLSSGDVDKTQYGQLSALFKSVNNDIDHWASVTGKPEITMQIKAANEAYKNYVVKYSVLQRAYDKASGETGAGEMFSPKKFSTALKTIAYKDKVFGTFKPKEIDERTGIANIMQVVQRAGQYKETPPTGARYGGIITTLLTGAKAIPYVLALRVLTTTDSGRKLALTASKIEPTSPYMIKIMEQLYNQIPKGMANIATSEEAITPESSSGFTWSETEGLKPE